MLSNSHSSSVLSLLALDYSHIKYMLFLSHFKCFRSSHQGVREEGECEGSQRQNYVCPWHKGTVNSFITVKMDSMCMCVVRPSFCSLCFSFSLFSGIQYFTSALLLSKWQIALSSVLQFGPNVTRYLHPELCHGCRVCTAGFIAMATQEIMYLGDCTIAPPGGRQSSMHFEQPQTKEQHMIDLVCSTSYCFVIKDATEVFDNSIHFLCTAHFASFLNNCSM